MNRRDFLKRIAAAGLVAAVPQVIVPERRFWQLDQTMASGNTFIDPTRFEMIPPDRRRVGDAAYIQWHIDHGAKLPANYYVIDREMRFAPGQKLRMDDTVLTVIKVDTPTDERGHQVAAILNPGNAAVHMRDLFDGVGMVSPMSHPYGTLGGIRTYPDMDRMYLEWVSSKMDRP